MPIEFKERNIEIRSDEFNEILGTPPSWVLRGGIFICSIIIFIIIVGCWVFHYPDVIKSPILITSANPPYNIVARTEGKIMYFLVKDRESVVDGEYLVIFQNSADRIAINKLRAFLKQTDTIRWSLQNLELSKQPLSNLGELQHPYLNFSQAVKNFQRHQSLAVNRKKIYNLKQQIEVIYFYMDSLKAQNRIHTIDISSIIGYTHFKIQIKQLENQIQELILTEELESSMLIEEINNSYEKLKSDFISWESTYVLKCTTSGIVSLGNYWSSNQNVKVGDIVMTIIPNTKETPYGKVFLNIENSGKVRIGQKVNIKLLNFPYTEYGTLSGKVKSISLVPDKGQYYVEIKLDNTKTSCNRQLPSLMEMTGTAEIITQDMRLIERIIAPLQPH